MSSVGSVDSPFVRERKTGSTTRTMTARPVPIGLTCVDERRVQVRDDRADPGPRAQGSRMNITLRLRILGYAMVVAGVGTAGAGFLYGLPQANDGLDSAMAMYESQGVSLSYNDEGQLIDRGTVEGAQAIMDLLVKDYEYPVKMSDFDPDDPLVNTRSELMYEYATITYHVLHTTVAVKLTEADVPITYRGVEYTEPGTYNITLEHYYAHLDRSNPIEAQLRAAWSPLAFSLTSSLAGAHANQAAGELARMTTLGIGAIGLLFTALGAGLVWATYGRLAPADAPRAPAP